MTDKGRYQAGVSVAGQVTKQLNSFMGFNWLKQAKRCRRKSRSG